MRRKVRLLSYSIAAIVVLALLTLIAFTVDRPPPPLPMPNPNGFHDFVKATTTTTDNIYDYTTMERDGLRALIAQNAAALRLLRQGLRHQCHVPIDYTDTNSIATTTSQLASLKRLTYLFLAEGHLAEVEDRPFEAAESYLDAIRYGNESSRGGLIIHRLVGTSIEALGLQPLLQLSSRLPCESARNIIEQLEAIDAQQVPSAEIWQNQKRCRAANFNPFKQFLTFWQRRRLDMQHKDRITRIVAHVRLLTAELALRCYRSEEGRVPTRLQDLVPKYLHRVPSDPFNSNPLSYHSQGTNWLLYSVGPDRMDDSGKPMGRGLTSKGDVFFDSPW